MGESKRKRDRVLQIAQKQGYSAPPAAVLVHGTLRSTRTGAALRPDLTVDERRERRQAQKLARRGRLPALRVQLGDRQFRLLTTSGETMDVYELDRGRWTYVSDHSTRKSVFAEAGRQQVQSESVGGQ